MGNSFQGLATALASYEPLVGIDSRCDSPDREEGPGGLSKTRELVDRPSKAPALQTDRSENFSLIIETRGQIEFPDRGNIGHYAPFDYALADDRLPRKSRAYARISPYSLKCSKWKD
jgi:hypothetical protein